MSYINIHTWFWVLSLFWSYSGRIEQYHIYIVRLYKFVYRFCNTVYTVVAIALTLGLCGQCYIYLIHWKVYQFLNRFYINFILSQYISILQCNITEGLNVYCPYIWELVKFTWNIKVQLPVYISLPVSRFLIIHLKGVSLIFQHLRNSLSYVTSVGWTFYFLAACTIYSLHYQHQTFSFIFKMFSFFF